MMDTNNSSLPACWRNNRKIAIAPPPTIADENQHKMCQKPRNINAKPPSPRNRHNRKTNNGRNGSSRKSKQANKYHRQPGISDEEKSRYLALDAEMVGFGQDGIASALARVTIVDWSGSIVLDAYVQVDQPVTDYGTFVSGITSQHLLPDNGAIPFDECRSKVAKILHDKIVIGHALKNDLAVLRIHHPWQDIRDTAKYEPFMKTRFDDGVLWPRKLRDLCKEKLGKDIQQPGQPHSPIEDATSALDLYKNVRTKWEKAMQYKINRTEEIIRKKTEAAMLVRLENVESSFAATKLVECSIGVAAF